MIRVAGLKLNGNIRLVQSEKGAEIELLIPKDQSLTEEEVNAIKNATELEEYVLNYGVESETIGTYALYGWRRIERDWDGGLIVSWQTYRTTDIEQIKQDNEDLTQAVLELAQIVGGDNG